VEFAGGSDPFINVEEIGSNPQVKRLIWDLKTGVNASEIEETMYVYLNYTMDHVHTTVKDVDTYDYAHAMEHAIEIKELPIELSTWNLIAVYKEHQSILVDITAKDDIYNLEFVPSRGIKDFTTITPAAADSILTGNSLELNITIEPPQMLEFGQVLIVWSTDAEGAEMDSMAVKVTITEKEVQEPEALESEKKSDGSWLMGRIIGFAAFILLITMIFTGGLIKGVSKRLNKAVGGGKRRVLIHCAVSYQMLALALLHAALLMYGRYSSLIFNDIFLIAEQEIVYINLGTFTWIMMIALSFIGVFQRSLTKKMGHKNWRRLHLAIAVTAIALITLHLLIVGTTLGVPLKEFI
jgi:DMSO/TMAO reductase YedYZ heme-binding membrane subunit